MRTTILLLALVTAVTGCAQSAARTSGTYAAPGLVDPLGSEMTVPASFGRAADRPPESLFPSDQAVMSSEAVEKILAAKVTLPSKARVAVIRVGERRYWSWSEELARLDKQVVDQFLTKLQVSKRIEHAALLPALLLPQRITVPYVREAGARYQADLIVVYHTSTLNYEKQKFLAPDETKAYCTIEAVLLDTRTGLVPFATVATETYEAKKTRDDISFYETVWKAEMSATGKALDKIAADIVSYLDSAP